MRGPLKTNLVPYNGGPDVRWLLTSVCPSSVVRPALSSEFDSRNLLITVIVRFVDNTCGMTQKSNRIEGGQLFIAVEIFLL